MTTTTIPAGATSSNLSIDAGDTLIVLAGGSATHIVDSGGAIYVSAGGATSDVAFSFNAYGFEILSGGTAYATTLTNGGTLVLDGGLASGTEIENFGYEFVYSGVTEDAILTGGGDDIEPGGIASGTKILSGGFQTVDGGASDNVTVSSGGRQFVYYGGAASATAVLSGAEQSLNSGSAVFTQISDGGLLMDAGTASASVVSSGGLAVVQPGAMAANTDLLTGGALVVLPGGQAIGTSGGGQVISTGVVYDTVSGGLVYNPAGPIRVISGALNYVLPKGEASLTTVGALGQQLVLGGSTQGIVVSGGAQTLSAGTAYGTVLSAYGEQFVLGGAASGTVVRDGGYLLAGGGNIVAPLVSAGGHLDIYAGGSVSGAVLGGGSGTVFAGFASATVLSDGGTLLVQGATSDTQVFSGGTEILDNGTASGSVVYVGGTQLVSGGFAFGTETASGGTEFVSAGFAYDSIIGPGGTLVAGGAGVLSGGVTFAGAGAALELGADGGYPLPTVAAPITGFAPGDTLSLTALTDTPGVSSATLAGGLLTITTSAGVTYDLPFAGAGQDFTTQPGALGGMEITVAPLCFAAGTLIATPKGKRPVQNFKIGDLVETMHGGIQPVKWVGRYRLDAETLAEHPEMRPVLIKADALDNGIPTHDLYVSPGHGICIDGALIPAGRLINNITIERDDLATEVEYVHLELEEHEVLIAEGCGVESFIDDGYRGRFENAAEYDALYPEPLPWPAVPCLETILEGFVLDAILLRLAERAGIPPVEPINGRLRGFVDQAGPELAAGWAQDEDQPEMPVCLDILEDGVRILRTLANRYRDDLRVAGIGSGNHAFATPLPEGTSGVIEIRRTIDQQPLPLTDAARGPEK